MRLQIGIHRHNLPPVNIIYNTSSSQPVVRTVSELLAALDKLVPLESTDGEWGLEDYIVEVAATSDQDNLYECLHYQLVKDVFREDDEVVIRGLTTDEIRERRQGGRLQILSDGRHLFDGVAWGRRYNIHASRPGITIPPRKRRRLLPDEEYGAEHDDDPLQIDHSGSNLQVGTVMEEDEDEDEDDEYAEENDEDEDDEYAEENDDGPEESARIIARQDFDDADEDSQLSEDDLLEDHAGNLDEDEVQLLLKEAGEVEDAYQSLPLEARITSPSKKRKRGRIDDSSTDRRHVTFDGFPSSARELPITTTAEDGVEGQVQGKIGDHVVVEPAEEAQLTNGHKMVDSPIVDTQQNQINVEDGSAESELGSESGSESTSSSDDAESDSDDDSESGEESSDDESEAGSDTSNSTSESESESDSSSDLSVIKLQSEKHKTPLLKNSALSVSTDHKTASESTKTPKVDNPPGSGTKRTRLNNHRSKLRKRLLHMKSQGLLPPEADFDAMRAYESDKTAEMPQPDTAPSISAELAQRKEEMLARLSNVYDDQVEEPHDEEMAFVKDSQPLINQVPTDLPAQASDGHTDTVANDVSPDTSQKRVRLDVESSRRMLFSSLGLRNPKTPAAEQALRDKLSKPVRNIASRLPDEHVQQPIMSEDDSWRDKLIISAVECVQEGLVLSPPPFPFKQRWERGTHSKKARSSAQYQQDSQMSQAETIHATELHSFREELSQKVQAQVEPAGNDIVYPSNISVLPALSRDDVQIGAFIAYRQLQLGPKFEPEESPYRVGRITAIEEDLIDIVLCEQDRDVPSTTNFDEETGEQLFGKFEIPVDENRAPDDGLRETTFEDMIQPKLVCAANPQVARSDGHSRIEATDLSTNKNSALIPESVLNPASAIDQEETEQVELDTPTRNDISGIIRAAGFKTSLDEKLLKPIDMPKTHQATGPSNASSQKGTGKDRRSSPLGALAQSEDAIVDASSPPSISMVETVDYPHVSHLDINQSSLVDPTGSSSHQDAQRMSPSVYDNDESGLSHSHLRVNALGTVHEDSQASSLASEVPQSQQTGIQARVQNEVSRNAFANIKALGVDGTADMDEGLDSEDVDSDGFPSLRSLTSSQKERSSRPSNFRVSPPPVRKNKPTHVTTVNASSFRHNQNQAAGVSASTSPVLSPEIKISASQRPLFPLSQIAQDTSIVDLTVSSDPVDPPSEEDIEYESPRARRASRRGAKAPSQSQSRSGQTESAGAGMKRSMRGVFTRLEGRRALSSSGNGKARSRV